MITDDDSGGFLTSAARFNARAGTDYYVSVEGFGGARGTIVLTWCLEATSQEVPIIRSFGPSRTISSNATLTLNVNAQGTPPLFYTWYLNGEVIPGITNSQFQTQMDPAWVGAYRVAVSNNFRGVLSEFAYIDLHDSNENQRSHDKFKNSVGDIGGGLVGGGKGAPVSNLTPLTEGVGIHILNNQNSTTEIDELLKAGQTGGASRWVGFTVGSVPKKLKVEARGERGQVVLLALYVDTTGELQGLSLRASSGDTNASGVTSFEIDSEANKRYVVGLDTAFGEPDQITLKVGFGTKPVLTSSPANRIALKGSNVTFNAVVTATPAASYQWFQGSSAMAGKTSPSLTLTNVQTNQGGTYRLVASNFFGVVPSSVVSLTVVSPPTPTNRVVNEGTNVSFTVAAVGGTAPSYQWRLGVLPRATASTYSIASVSAVDQGLYTVVVSNNAGSVTSPPVNLQVNTWPRITTHPQSWAVRRTNNHTFTVQATGTPLPSYQWFFNNVGNPISGATGSSYTLNNIQSSAAGNYFVRVTNSVSNVYSFSAALDVVLEPRPSIPPGSSSYQWCLPAPDRWRRRADCHLRFDQSPDLDSHLYQHRNQPLSIHRHQRFRQVKIL